ncbi:MAG: adenylate cyclase [Chloroflexi bacterium]|nr:MAG: adenylate cyclase [Chloroflexota bacterium]
MHRIAMTSALALVLLVGTGSIASATGQPNQSCEDQPNRPGQSASAPGSAFNPSGVAGTHYAGQQPQNSVNPNSVSQYDVACAKVSSH